MLVLGHSYLAAGQLGWGSPSQGHPCGHSVVECEGLLPSVTSQNPSKHVISSRISCAGLYLVWALACNLIKAAAECKISSVCYSSKASSRKATNV